MEYILQDDILSIILLSFEEDTSEKLKAVKSTYKHLNETIRIANRKELTSTINFIDFLDSLYTDDDVCIKTSLGIIEREILKVLTIDPEVEQECGIRLN